MRQCRSWYRIHQLLRTHLPLPPGPDARRMRIECGRKKHGRLPVSCWFLIQDNPPCFFCFLDRFFTPDWLYLPLSAPSAHPI